MNDLSESVAKSFGAKLLQARKKAGLSQEELAYLGGVDRTAISPLELGRHTPRLDTVIKLAGALGISPCELIADIRWVPPTQDPVSGKFRKI